MKKRQKPVLLGTLLILLIGGAIAMNMSANAKPEAEQAQHSEDEHGLGETRKVDNSQVGKTSAAALEADAGSGKPGLAPKLRPGGGNDGLVRAKPAATKPTPRDSSTSSQWYTEESAKTNKG